MRLRRGEAAAARAAAINARRPGGQAAAPPGGGRARRWGRAPGSPGWEKPAGSGVPAGGGPGNGEPGKWRRQVLGNVGPAE